MSVHSSHSLFPNRLWESLSYLNNTRLPIATLNAAWRSISPPVKLSPGI